MERALEGDEVCAFGVAASIVILTRHLDRAFERFSAGVREEHRVGEGRVDQLFGELFLTGDAVDVRQVPDFMRLFGQSGDQIGVAVAQRVDGNACAKVEIARAVGCEQIRAFAPLKFEVGPRIGRQNWGNHGNSPSQKSRTAQAPEYQGTAWLYVQARVGVRAANMTASAANRGVLQVSVVGSRTGSS